MLIAHCHQLISKEIFCIYFDLRVKFFEVVEMNLHEIT